MKNLVQQRNCPSWPLFCCTVWPPPPNFLKFLTNNYDPNLWSNMPKYYPNLWPKWPFRIQKSATKSFRSEMTPPPLHFFWKFIQFAEFSCPLVWKQNFKFCLYTKHVFKLLLKQYFPFRQSSFQKSFLDFVFIFSFLATFVIFLEHQVLCQTLDDKYSVNQTVQCESQIQYRISEVWFDQWVFSEDLLNVLQDTIKHVYSGYKTSQAIIPFYLIVNFNFSIFYYQIFFYQIFFYQIFFYQIFLYQIFFITR